MSKKKKDDTAENGTKKKVESKSLRQRICFFPGCRRSIKPEGYFCSEHTGDAKKPARD